MSEDYILDLCRTKPIITIGIQPLMAIKPTLSAFGVEVELVQLKDNVLNGKLVSRIQILSKEGVYLKRALNDPDFINTINVNIFRIKEIVELFNTIRQWQFKCDEVVNSNTLPGIEKVYQTYTINDYLTTLKCVIELDNFKRFKCCEIVLSDGNSIITTIFELISQISEGKYNADNYER